MLLTQSALSALDLALESAGNSSPARMAMMATTTSSSMSVNAGESCRRNRTDEHVIFITRPIRETLLWNTSPFYAFPRKTQVCVWTPTFLEFDTGGPPPDGIPRWQFPNAVPPRRARG